MTRRRKSNIVLLPGVDPAFHEAPVPVRTVLREASRQSFSEVTVIGVRKDGTLGLFASGSDRDRVIGQMHQAMQWLAFRDLK